MKVNERVVSQKQLKEVQITEVILDIMNCVKDKEEHCHISKKEYCEVGSNPKIVGNDNIGHR